MKNFDFKKWFASEEGKKSLDDFAEKIEKEEEIKSKQLEKFHCKFSSEEMFSNFVEKTILKYSSDSYRGSWYKRGIEPPEKLYWFLFHYAEKYGRSCTEAEWKHLGNMFTSDLFFVNGYYFNKMDGQGSVVHVIKQENKEL